MTRAAAPSAAGVLALLLGACAHGSAGGPMATDRPDFTEGPGAVAPGWTQLEAGYTMEATGGSAVHTMGEVLVRAGVSPGLEARLGLNSYALDDGGPTDGMEDPTIGAKLELPAVAGAEGVAILAAASLPVGAEAVSAGRVVPEVVLAGAWGLGGGLELGTNFGYAHTPSATRDGELLASAALGIPLTARLGAFMETYTLAPLAGEASVFADGGLTWSVSDQLQLDIRAGSSLTTPRTTIFGLGLARRW